MKQPDANHGNLTKGGHIGSESGQDEDFGHLREGDKDPTSGKEIGKIIMNDPDYIVFLDENHDIEWAVTHQYEKVKEGFSELFGEVVAKVTELEGLSETFYMSGQQEKECKTLLGSALVLMLEKDKPALIGEVLNKAEKYIRDRMTETARTWYLLSSISVTVLALIGMLFVVLFQSGVTKHFGLTGYDIMLGTGMGAMGALISIITRSNKLSVSLSAGKLINWLEAGARVFAGMLGALLIALAIKSEIFFSVLNTASNPLAVLLTICTVAGASERIVPSLVKKVENMTEEEKPKNGNSSNETPEVPTK